MNSPANPYQSSTSTESGVNLSDAKRPNLFKRIVKWVFYIFLFFVIAFAAVIFWVLSQQSEYESTAVPYIESVIPDITTWDPEVIWAYYDQDVKDLISKDENDKFIRYVSKLGGLESLGTPQFQRVESSASTGSGTRKFIFYSIPAKFDNGDASIDLTVLDRKGEFSIYHFRINSMAFLDEAGESGESE